jgi:proline iminopeptidase
MRARIRDTEIYLDVDGAALVADGPLMRERPTALLSHGGPGSDHAGLKERYGQLKDKMQLVYFDHRGHGRSSRGDPRKYTLDDNVEDMEALRKYLGLESIVSIGTSYGGMVAMGHAARYPDAVSHLILLVTASHAGFIKRAEDILVQRGSSEQRAQFQELLAGRIDNAEKMRHYHKIMGPLYSVKYDHAAAKAGLDRAIFSPEPQNCAFAPGGHMRQFDLRPSLASITAPTLILCGRHDWICAPEFSQEIHGLIAGSELRIFENSSHFIAADEQQNVLDAISGFVVYNSRRPGA